jgi:hypothetical protein
MFKNWNKVEYQTAEGQLTFEEIGTVAENCKDWTLRFTNRNLRSETKKVCIIGKDKNGEEYTLPCTKPLSDVIRKSLAKGAPKSKVLEAVVNLQIIVSDDGERYFITLPSEGANEAFAVTTLIKAKATIAQVAEAEWDS